MSKNLYISKICSIFAPHFTNNNKKRSYIMPIRYCTQITLYNNNNKNYAIMKNEIYQIVIKRSITTNIHK